MLTVLTNSPICRLMRSYLITTTQCSQHKSTPVMYLSKFFVFGPPKLLAFSRTISASSTFQRDAPSPSTAPDLPRKPRNASFVANTFRGQIVSEQLFPYPVNLDEEKTQDLQILTTPIERFFKDVNNASKNDTNEAIDPNVFRGLWELGLFALQIPVDLGGVGLSNIQYMRLIQIAGENDLGVGVTLMTHQELGYKGILAFGNEPQKKKYLPRLACDELAAFCLTEPGMGSDFRNISTTARLNEDKTHYILSGIKSFVCNGSNCDVMTVFAKTKTMDEKSGEPTDRMTAFIVEKRFGGITSSPTEKTMGLRSSNISTLTFRNVRIPASNVLGKEGEGFGIAMQILNNGRSGMAALLSGTMRNCIAQAVAHACYRARFEHRMETFGSVQEKLARMAMVQYVAESMAYHVGSRMEGGSEECQMEVAIAKCFVSEAAWKVCDQCIQIMGPTGYLKKSTLERTLRDLRAFRLTEGTNELLRLLIALSGIHYTKSLLSDPKSPPSIKTKNSLQKVVEEFTTRSREDPPAVGSLVHNELRRTAVLVSNSIDSFGAVVEYLLRKYGDDVLEKQMLLLRVANCAIDIYTMAVALSRASSSLRQELESSHYERVITQCWCNEAFDRIQQNLTVLISEEKLENFGRFSELSSVMCQSGGVKQLCPLNL